MIEITLTQVGARCLIVYFSICTFIMIIKNNNRQYHIKTAYKDTIMTCGDHIVFFLLK